MARRTHQKNDRREHTRGDQQGPGRAPKPRDTVFGGDAREARCASPPAPGDLSSVFARFRFLAKAISEAEMERAQRQESRMPRGFYAFGSGAPTASAIRPAQCSRLPS